MPGENPFVVAEEQLGRDLPIGRGFEKSNEGGLIFLNGGLALDIDAVDSMRAGEGEERALRPPVGNDIFVPLPDRARLVTLHLLIRLGGSGKDNQ